MRGGGKTTVESCRCIDVPDWQCAIRPVPTAIASSLHQGDGSVARRGVRRSVLGASQARASALRRLAGGGARGDLETDRGASTFWFRVLKLPRIPFEER